MSGRKRFRARWVIAAAALAVLVVVFILIGNGTFGRRVILYNNNAGATAVMAATDPRALASALREDPMETKIAETDGKLFYVSNGSRGIVIGEGVPLIGSVRSFRVKLVTGTGAGLTVFVTSSVILADNH